MQGLHPRLITEGFELARNKSLEVLEAVKVKREMDRSALIEVARTSLRTKVCNDIFIFFLSILFVCFTIIMFFSFQSHLPTELSNPCRYVYQYVSYLHW